MRTSATDDEFDRFLSTGPEDVKDALAWWNQNRAVYPRLARMAFDYLTIPGKSQALANQCYIFN